MALGKGLSSLIGDRDSSTAEDVLEKVDSMEEGQIEERIEEKQEVIKIRKEEAPAKARKEEALVDEAPKKTKKIDVIEDFDDIEELEGDQELAPPSKPLVTPITIDPDEADSEEAQEPVNVTELAKEQIPADLQEQQQVQDEQKGKREQLTQEKKKRKEESVLEPSFSETAGVGANIWDKHEERVEHIAIGDIYINPLQPRRKFDPDDMKELQDSIEKHGILQPLVVRRLAEGQGYELVAGERRLRAAKALKWEKVPCVIRRDVKSDQSRLVYALVENIQRENLNPIEEAMAYRSLNEEYGITHEEIGERVGKSRVAITNAVRVLHLPAEIQRGIVENSITMGHARAILMIPDEEKQVRFFRHLVDEGLTVRKAEIRARRIQRTMNLRDPMRQKRRRGRHAIALKYAPKLEERYGYAADIRYNAEKNRFDVILKAHSDAEINELVGRLLGTVDLPGKDQDADIIED